MKTAKFLQLVMAALSAALFILVPIVWAGDQPVSPAAEQSQLVQGQTTVRGTIVAEKNKNGAIIGYVLQEAGGQSAMLSKEGQGMELRKMVGKKVEAVGTLEEVHGKTTITVNEFKEIK